MSEVLRRASALTQSLDVKEGKRQLLVSKLNTASTKVEELEEEQGHLTEARAVLQKVARETQEQLKFHIEELVTLALEEVFPEPYSFEVLFVDKRGRTECELSFIDKSGERLDPMTATGGGAIDVAAFALRIAIWSIQRPQSEPVLILDEPFRFLSLDLQPKAAMMMDQLSKRLGIQIIMVTHSEVLAEMAN